MRLLDADVGQQGVSDRLIHADRRRKGITAHIGDTRQYKQPLYRTILPAFAMQNRESHINTPCFVFAFFHDKQPMRFPIRGEYGGETVGFPFRTWLLA